MSADSPAAMEGVAIIGMAGKFPGANDVAAFWEVLASGRETIATLSPADIPDEERKSDPDYVPRRGLLDQPEWFDAAFFNISPREAAVMDPQQRLFLEICWHALEHAGCDPSRFAGSIGVFAGMSNNSWFPREVLLNHTLRDHAGYETAMIANEKDYLATRVAWKLNLRGPALNIYTACSTSLVAVCQAVQALQSYQCDAALAGGVSVKWPQPRGYTFMEGGILSPDGHCRPYDAAARGTVFSNGAGVVVLKRLEDAVRDGDPVWAVIKGAALNNDGAGKVSFTAPGVDGHAGVIAMAHALAAIEPDTITFVEGHGTATPIGDPIEVAGLTKAFRHHTARNQFCALGSLKSNFGHMDAAAGVAGLIKTALALHHRHIPATLHFQFPNPALQLEASPFYVADKLTPWPAGNHPRRAGVSSFGVGGTNAHCVLEEAPESPAAPKSGTEQLIILSAKSAAALDTLSENIAAWLEENPDKVPAAAWTLQTGRSQWPLRRAISAADAADAAVQLRALPRVSTAAEAPRLVFLFPGQGAQHLRMGAETYARETVFRDHFDQCADLFQPLTGFDLRGVLRATDESLAQSLTETNLAQPALLSVEYALAQLLISWGLRPSLLLGHSIGEYTAAAVSGILSLEDAVTLVAARGRLLAARPRGSMLAVRMPEVEVRALLPETLDIAAINAPSLTVVSGLDHDIDAFSAVMESKSLPARRLHTSHAFHSRLMDGALDDFRRAFDGVTLHPPQIPVASNVSGRLLTTGEADAGYFVRHVRHTVRFADGVAAACQDGPCLFIECGPGTSLAPLVKQHPAAAQSTAVSCFPCAGSRGAGEYMALLAAAGRAWCLGAELEWAAMHARRPPRRISLPLYPFERHRFCPDTPLPPGTVRDGEGWLMLPQSMQDTVPPVGGEVIAAPTIGAGGVNLVPPLLESGGVTRRDLLLAELRTQLHRISGIDLSAADPATAFLDLGFDSLFLTQASVSLRRHFGLKITFRQMMEDLTGMDALAAWLDLNLPPDKFAVSAVKTVATPDAVTGDCGEVEDGRRLKAAATVEARLARLEASLAGLGGAPGGHGPPPVRVRDLKASGDTKVAFGPFKPVERTSDGSLTARQMAHLQQLITDYCQRYPLAKAFAASHREAFADPRTAAGFNVLWKEMVFPAVVDRSEGAYLLDTDGHRWIDVVQGFGLGMFGHRPDFVVRALHEQLDRGFEIGPTSPLAGEVALLVKKLSGQDRVAFCNTGSEALMAAIRVSRTVTRRDRIVMFAGAYHGIFDEVLARPLVQNGELRSIAIAPGIPASAHANLLVLEYGHPESLEILQRMGSEIACVLVEPVMSRQPDHVPVEFVRELRRITRETGTALVFDEVVLGFRTGPGGAQGFFGITADLVAYGKVLGGGMPLGVLCGARSFMDALDGGAWQYGDDSRPEAGVTFFAGTFIRHPLALAAARAVLHKLKEEGPALTQALNAKTQDFTDRLNALFADAGVPVKAARFSSMWMLHADPALKFSALLFYHLRLRGIHLWEGRPGFLSTAHTTDDVTAILRAFDESIRVLQAGGFFPGRDETTFSRRGTAAQRGGFHGEDCGQDARATSIRVTAAQREMFLQSQLSEDAARACHESISVAFEGHVDPVRLARALDAVVCRHDSLRATFTGDGHTMEVRPQGTWPLRVVTDQPVASVEESEFLTAFELSTGPLVRAALVERGGGHTLILTVHHIICDGWSFGVVLDDLRRAYQGEALPEKATTFAEFADHDRAGEASLEFWRAKFQTLPGPLVMPADFARSGGARYAAAAISRGIPADIVRAMRGFCAERKLTPYQVMLAAFEALVFRLSGNGDFVVGTPVAAQVSENIPDLVGHAVRFLPLRACVDSGESAASLLQRVRDDLLDATDHQGASLGDILDSLKGLGAGARRHFVPITFSFEPIPALLPLDSVPGRVVMNPKRRLAFELSLFVFWGRDEAHVTFAYHESLYRGATIERWLGHLETLLRAMLAAPDTLVQALPLLTGIERTALIHGFHPPPPPASTPATLVHWFRESAERFADRTAVSCGGDSLTYRELDARAARLARHLQTLGVAPERLAGICLERSIDMVVAILAVLTAGGAYLPIDLSYPAERLAFMLEDAQAAVLVTQRTLAARLPAHPVKTVFIDDLDGLDATDKECGEPECAATAENMAYVIYTSGSTGRPKGCIITHHNVCRFVQQTNEWFHCDERDVWTLFHSIAFDFSVWEMWGALLYGGRLVVVPYLVSRSPDDFHRLLADEGVTILNQTPGAFRQLIHADAQSHRPLKLRWVILGGEALEMASLRPWFEKHGDVTPRIANAYGITETTVLVTCRFLSMRDTAGASVIGKPMADLQLYILDPVTLEPVPPGVTGEIFVGGPGLARGYLRRPELTAERFLPNHLTSHGSLYRSGDLARFVVTGSSGAEFDVEYLGRIDHQVKIRGFRIELGEIESVLSGHPAVQECSVLAVPDHHGEQRLVAWLVYRSEPPPDHELRTHVLEQLPDYMAPAAFVALQRFPLTSNGKLDRAALPWPDSTRSLSGANGDGGGAPATPTQQRLALVWESVLGSNHFSTRADFFALGGTSLNALRVSRRIREEFGVTLPLGTFFEAPTLEALAARIELAARGTGARAPVFCIQPEGTRTPLFLLHGGDGGALFYRALLPGLSRDHPVWVIESPALTDDSWLLARHSIESCAIEYLKLIRSVHPQGPVILGGYSYGGVVAYEIARLLRAAHHEAEMLILFDTENPADGPRHLSLTERVAAGWHQGGSGVLNKLKHLGTRFATGLRGRLKHESSVAAARALLARGSAATDDSLRTIQIRESHAGALDAYSPPGYDGTMLLFRSDAVSDKYERSADYHWTDCVRELRIVRVSGDHLELFGEPHAAGLAAKLRHELQRHATVTAG